MGSGQSQDQLWTERDLEVVHYQAGCLSILDQTRLPHEEIWLDLRTPERIVEAIRALRVRGAPLLGIVGAYGVAVAAHETSDALASIERWAPELRGARPTATNLGWGVDRVVAKARQAAGGGDAAVREAVDGEARTVHADEQAACRQMGKLGADLLPADTRILTYCNTGALATGGIGTAFGVIATAFERGQLEGVWVPETRPLLQGARLTAWELKRLGIPGTLVADAAIGGLFAQGRVDAVVVGADRIAANGDVANKVGTYVVAALAARHGIPFYVAAPTSTVDVATPSGSTIPIEERAHEEVARFGGLATAPSGMEVWNPAFDVTPAELVGAIVTETEVCRPPYRFGA